MDYHDKLKDLELQVQSLRNELFKYLVIDLSLYIFNDILKVFF